jgi:hypothetical protein
MTDIVSHSMGSGLNLATQFGEEDSVDKSDYFLHKLELAPVEDWTEGGAMGPAPPPFAPTAGQWDLLVKRISGLARDLGDAQRALSLLAEESDNHLEVLDDQVTAIRASVGWRPIIPCVNILGMESWMSVSSLSDTLQGVKHHIYHPVPNRFDLATRDIAHNAARDAQAAKYYKAGLLMETKASLQNSHKPLASLVDGIVANLYQPSGMYNHLLNSSVGGTPVHPAMNYKDDLVKLKNELQQDLRSAKRSGGQSVDPEDSTISLMIATLKNVEVSLKTIKASLGGEVVRFDSETFQHSAKEVEVWVIENMGKDVGFPDYFYDIISILEAL